MPNSVRGEVRASLDGVERLFLVTHAAIAEVESGVEDGWPVVAMRILKGKMRFTDISLLVSAAAAAGAKESKQPPLGYEDCMELCIRDMPTIHRVALDLMISLYKDADSGKAGATAS